MLLCFDMTASVPSVERALAILELLACSRSGLTLSEITRRANLPKSSSYGLLLTLERCGYLYRHAPTNRYRFALKLFRLADTALNGIELRERAAPYVRRLVEEARLTAHLGVVENNRIVVIDKLEPPGTFRLATWIGKAFDLHCSALGKAVLAAWTEEQLRRFMRDCGLPRYNDNTIVSLKRLRKQLEQFQRQGFAIDDEEGEIGFRCVGAAVFDDDGKAYAAVSLSGNTTEIGHDDFERLGELVCNTAAAISAQSSKARSRSATAGAPPTRRPGDRAADRPRTAVQPAERKLGALSSRALPSSLFRPIISPTVGNFAPVEYKLGV
jgi:DNA-binding IclR family transcriptional regulator